jgi:hypothetical protein
MVNYNKAEPTLNSVGINLDDDFHGLSSTQIETLLPLAKIQKYKAPKNANGSTARYFFYALKRNKNKGMKE